MADLSVSLNRLTLKNPILVASGTFGYAKEMTEERAARQRELLTPYITESDVLITTAAVPGRHQDRKLHRHRLPYSHPQQLLF